MTKTNPVMEPSLLPYCQPRVPGVGLRIVTSDALSADPAMPSAAVVENCGPLADLLWAQVVLDGNRSIHEIALLVQADRYRLAPSELQPITNSDVENQWQQAMDRGPARQGDELALPIPSQRDPQGRVVPFRPLFYCRFKERYGHALCPGCGAGLTLCRDEKLLKSAGLPGYKDSLARYLYCPACHQTSPESPFYASTKEAGQPANVRDSRELIENFSALLAKEALSAELPCVGCDEAANCYGPQTLVLDRMRPVRFYPFYLILQPAASLNALEFIALLSNAAPAEIAQNLIQGQNSDRLLKFRQLQDGSDQRGGFLFSSQSRLFLEVLNLKVAFLRELCVLIFNLPAGTPQPVADLSLRGIWIRLQHSGTRLPFLWNFSLHLVDSVGQPAKTGSEAALARAHVRRFLARAWFYVLLVNADQTIEDVLAVVEPLAVGSSKERLKDSTPEQRDSVLAARNIFWHEPSFEIDLAWDSLWTRSLALGLELMGTGGEWSEGEFGRQLADLQNQVHQTLFQTPAILEESRPAAAHPETESVPDDDLHIARILQELLQQWPSAPEEDNAETAADQTQELQATQIIRPNEDGDFEETVILSVEERRAIDRPAPQPATPTMAETVIITPKAPQKPAPPEEEDLQKTVLISPGNSGKSIPASPPSEDLDKTVLIQPRRTGQDEDLEETVIIGPGDKPPAAPKSKEPAEEPDKTGPRQKSKPPESDDLEATVIISPDPHKDRKPKP